MESGPGRGGGGSMNGFIQTETEARLLRHRWRRRNLLSPVAAPPCYQTESVDADSEEEDENSLGELDRLLAISEELLTSSKAALQSTRSTRTALSSLSLTLEGSLDRTVRASERELRRRLDLVEEKTVLVHSLDRQLHESGGAASSEMMKRGHSRSQAEEAREVQQVVVKAERAAGVARMEGLKVPPTKEESKLRPVEDGISPLSKPRRRPQPLPHVRSVSRTVPRYDTIYISADAALDPSIFRARDEEHSKSSKRSIVDAAAPQDEGASPSPSSPESPLSSSASPPSGSPLYGGPSFFGRFFRDQKSASPSPSVSRFAGGQPSPRASELLWQSVANVASTTTARRSSEPRVRSVSGQSSETVVATPSVPSPLRRDSDPHVKDPTSTESDRSSETLLSTSSSSSSSGSRGATSSAAVFSVPQNQGSLTSPVSSYEPEFVEGLERRTVASGNGSLSGLVEEDEDADVDDVWGGEATTSVGDTKVGPSTVRPRHRKQISGLGVAAPELHGETASAAVSGEGEGRPSPKEGIAGGSSASELLKSLWAKGGR